MLIIDKPMPKNCDECIFATGCSFCEGYDDHCVLNDGNAEIGFKNGKEYPYWDFSCEIIPKERPSWCPIKGVLPEEHGDLIDRDALLKHGMMYRDGIDEDGLIYVPSRDVMKSISNAPTVIAAERKDDGIHVG